ncbi:MAG: hypothetical protein M3O01_13920, partial [Pseudomonadota bacterium]|nr:hypothetical protein [Pseudomonadota bacterium]
MLTLDNLALQVPPSTRFHGDRANEAYPWHGLVSREASAWPQAARRHMGSAVPAVGPPGRDAGEILPVAPPGCALSDLAVVAAQRLARQGGAAVLARARHLVVAHATLSERMAESTACRVQHALQLDALVPFAISQCGPLGLYAALPVLEGLLAEGEHALLVAADKTLYPFHRVHPGLVQYA